MKIDEVKVFNEQVRHLFAHKDVVYKHDIQNATGFDEETLEWFLDALWRRKILIQLINPNFFEEEEYWFNRNKAD